MKLDVSIILVSYNTAKLTENCLESIFRKTSGVNFDVWVVDNNSEDNTCNIIETKYPQVHLIKNDKNLGFGVANNIAIKQSTAKYVFLLNTDTILLNNAVNILFNFMENNSSMGACGGNLYDINGKNVHSYGYFKTLKSKLVRVLGLSSFFPEEKIKIYDKGENQDNRLKEVDIIVGANLFIKKSILNEVGCFDEDFFMYDEEAELEFRIKKAGYQIFITPESKICHLEGKSNKNRLASRLHKMRSELLCYKKCYGETHLNLYKLLFCLSNLYRCFKQPVLINKMFKIIREI